MSDGITDTPTPDPLAPPVPNPVTPSLSREQAQFLTDAIEADSEFNDSDDETYAGWTTYSVDWPDGPGGQAVLHIEHEGAEDSDDERTITRGAFALVYIGGEVGPKSEFERRRKVAERERAAGEEPAGG